MMNQALLSSKSNEWGTPQDFFDKLNEQYHFDLDVASTDENAKCENHFTVRENGLEQSWVGHSVWCNPPYGRHIGEWVQKAYQESKMGAKIVMLIPSRTDTRWFHDYLLHGENVRIEFIRGRLKFGGSNSCAPFPSMLVFFNC